MSEEEKDNETPLCFASDDELLEEIVKRYRVAVFVGSKPNHQARYKFHGPTYTEVAGHLTFLNAAFRKDLRSRFDL